MRYPFILGFYILAAGWAVSEVFGDCQFKRLLYSEGQRNRLGMLN